MGGANKKLPMLFEVGFGKPPRHSRFKKGQSGNPGGRPSGMTQGRATDLALKQAFVASQYGRAARCCG